MLRLESHKEGFAVSWKGRPLLRHGSSSPCLFVSDHPPIQWMESAKGEGRWVRRGKKMASALREYRILESSADRIVVNFAGKLGLEIVQDEGRLTIGFVANEPPAGLRLDLEGTEGDAIFGGGADSETLVDVSRSRIEAWPSDAAFSGVGGLFSKPVKGRDWPIMSFVTESKRWYRVEGNGWMAADFRTRGRISFEFSHSGLLIRIGDEESMAMAVSALGRLSGPIVEPPPWTRRGPIVATSAKGADFEVLLRAIAAAGIRPAGVRLVDHDVLERGRGRDERFELLRAQGIRSLAVARPRPDIADSVDALIDEDTVLDVADMASSPPTAGLRIEPEAYLAAPTRNAGPTPEVRVARRSSYFSRRLHESALAHAASLGLDLGGEGFLLTSARGWGLGPLMHACSVPAAVDDISGIPRRMSAFLAHGLSGGGWAWLDASCTQCRRAGKGGTTESAALARRRAIELAAFGPVLEFDIPESSPSGETGRDEELRFLARMSAVFSSLGPYHDAVAAEYRESFLPPIRHSMIHYDGVVETLRTANQYLYGRDLLIAVSGRAGDFVSLDLPEDDWIHLWSSRRFRGGSVSIEAPSGQPAVFYRASSPFAALFDSVRLEARRK